MASAVDVCNLALTHIGDPGNVASIDPPEASPQGRYCARFYPIARDEVLEAHTWRFNTRRKALTSLPLPDAVAGEWSYAYSLPNECLRPFAVYVPGQTEVGKTEDFTVETADDGNQIVYANVPCAYLKYVVRVVDTNRWPPSFVDALAWKLATKLANPITQSDDKVKRALAGYQMAYAQATAMDAGTQSTEDWRKEEAPGWVDGR